MTKAENKTDIAIELGGGYYLVYDTLHPNYYVQKEYTNPKSGIRYMKRLSGYDHSIIDAIDSCLEHRIPEASAKTLKEMKKEIQDMKRDLKRWKVSLGVK